MERTEKNAHRYGLIGRHIAYSFSRGYFSNKFEQMGLLGHSYENFDLEHVDDFLQLLKGNELKGLNVTIPYKEAIIPFLNEVDKEAQKIGAINTIKFTKKGLIGYNTDVHGFKYSLMPLLKEHHKEALILGSGGASKAVAHVFDALGIAHKTVSRNKGGQNLTYSDLTKEKITHYTIIVNCTPLGTHPNIKDKPNIPYHHLGTEHLLYDLIYNPEKTAFLIEGEKMGATIKNGLEMLQLQAEKAWEIWNS